MERYNGVRECEEGCRGVLEETATMHEMVMYETRIGGS